MNFCFSVGQKQPMADVDPQSSTLEPTCQSLSNQPGAGSGRSRSAQPKWSRKQTLGVRQADGRIAPEPTMDVNEVGQAVAHSEPAALDQRPHHDHHGDQDALRWPGVAQPGGELSPE
jgi:hypothetical protein